MSDLKVRATLDGANYAAGIGRLEGLAGGLKSKLAGAFTVGAIGAGIKKLTDYADAIEEGASRAGISAKAHQEWSFGAEQNGADAEKLISFIERLTDAAQDLKNVGGFAAMGINPQGMTPEDLFRSVQSRTQGKGATEIQGMLQSAGMSFKEIGPMVNTLSADLGAAGASARRMGAIIDDATIRRLAALNDQLAIVGQVLMGNFAPAVLEAGIALIRFAAKYSGVGKVAGAVGENLGKQFGEEVNQKGWLRTLLGIVDPTELGRKAGASVTPDALSEYDKTVAVFEEMIAKLRNYTPPALPTIEPLPPPPDDKKPSKLSTDSGRGDSLISVGNFLGARVRDDIKSLQYEANKIAEKNGVRLDKIADKIEKVNTTLINNLQLKDKIIVP